MIRCIDLEGAEKLVKIYTWMGDHYDLTYEGVPTADKELEKVSKSVVLSTGLSADGTLILFAKDININTRTNPDETAQSSATISYDYQYTARNADGKIDNKRGSTSYTTKETDPIGANFIKDGAAIFSAIGKFQNNPNKYNYGKWGNDYLGNANQIRDELGIPSDWTVKGGKKDGGVRFVDPNNPNNHIRVMPGRTDSKFENSQKPYVIRYKDGAPVDVGGNKIENPSGQNQNKSGDLHVPADQFKYDE